MQKSYNSSQKEWYYGVKLHAFVVRKPGQLPAPIALFLSGAAVHDLKAAKQILRDNHILSAGKLYADNAYIDCEWADMLRDESAILVLTPSQKAQVGYHSLRGYLFHLCQLRPSASQVLFQLVKPFNQPSNRFYGPFAYGPAPAHLWSPCCGFSLFDF